MSFMNNINYTQNNPIFICLIQYTNILCVNHLRCSFLNKKISINNNEEKKF